MRKIINKLICIISGHVLYYNMHKDEWNRMIIDEKYCSRCGKAWEL